MMSFYVAFKFWVEWQDKHVVGSRIFAPVVVFLVALWVSFLFNLERVKGWMGGRRTAGVRHRNSDDGIADAGDLELSNVTTKGEESGKPRQRSIGSDDDEFDQHLKEVRGLEMRQKFVVVFFGDDHTRCVILTHRFAPRTLLAGYQCRHGPSYLRL